MLNVECFLRRNRSERQAVSAQPGHLLSPSLSPESFRGRGCAKGGRGGGTSRAAFSLIELLVTFALLLIIISYYFGFGSRSHQHQQQKFCQTNLQKILVALQIYATESQNAFPVLTNARSSEDVLNLLVPRYTSDTGIFICPGSKDSPLRAGEPLLGQRISYAYYMGMKNKEIHTPLLSDRQVNTNSKAVGAALFSQNGKPPGNNHHKYGGNILYCDGVVEHGTQMAAAPLQFTSRVRLLNPKP